MENDETESYNKTKTFKLKSDLTVPPKFQNANLPQ